MRPPPAPARSSPSTSRVDVPYRRAVVTRKGGRAELIGWETRTARLLPRYLAGREHGPLFLTDLGPPRPANPPADLDPASTGVRTGPLAPVPAA